jgi:hypothetical protein
MSLVTIKTKRELIIFSFSFYFSKRVLKYSFDNLIFLKKERFNMTLLNFNIEDKDIVLQILNDNTNIDYDIKYFEHEFILSVSEIDGFFIESQIIKRKKKYTYIDLLLEARFIELMKGYKGVKEDEED